jgi:hypothetical protein
MFGFPRWLPGGAYSISMKACLVSVVANLIAVLAVAPSAAGGTEPMLRIVGTSEVVISGAHFRPNERVTLRFVALGVPSVKVVRSTRAGRLVARIARTVPDCEGYTISAVGSRGSRVFHRELPPPCGIVIQP